MANEEKMAESDGYICPPCRIYYPTPQEFINPLTYIASIRAEASQTGICKIVPPQGWRPPFAVNEKKFRFRTRLQPLNSIEGNSRQEGKFLEALRMFLYRKGTPMHDLPTLNGKVANLSLLYKIVVDQGGYEAVTQQSSWSSVVHNLHELTDLLEVPCSTIEEDTRSVYSTWLLPYEIHQKGLEKSTSKTQNQGVVVNSPEHPSGAVLPIKRGRGRPKKVDMSDGSNVGSPTPCTPPDQRVESNESAQSTPIIFPGLIKRGRGRPRKGATPAVRILSSDVPEDVDPAELEPSALAADPERNSRLDPPMVRVGQKFYRSYQGGTTILGEVKRVIGGKKPTVSVEYAGGSKETISYGSMQLLLANGKDSASAELVLTNQICQYCLRGDCWEKMLLCDSCNGGYHIFCLSRPLAEVPQGDWYCEICMAEHEKESNTVSSEKFGFEMGAEYTLASFKAKADEWQQAYFQSSTIPTIQELEKEYWRVLLTPHQKIQVEYGSDIDTAAMGSGFPTIEKVRKVRNRLLDRYNSVHGNTNRDEDPNELGLRRLLAEGLKMDTESNFDYINQIDMYAHSPWNLTNLPKLNGSMLQYLDENIKGVMVPWLYVGMCFSTFCWHVEDHNFYSISYLHRGAPKTWYGVPGHAAAKMEEVMRKITPNLFGTQPDLHMQLVTMFSPTMLRKHGIPVYRATHEPNEFIVTFPSAYHSGYNNGFNLAEAVNFATPDWISWGHVAVQNYKKFGKIPVFSHDALLLTLTLASLERSDALDTDSIMSYLVPSLQILRDETMAFHDQVQSAGIIKTDSMETYLESHGKMSFARGSTRQKMMLHEDDSYEVRPSKMARTEKMSVGKMDFASNSRVSRQVQWAGRSGKHDGLRCSKCHQYCYIAAVVCVKCRFIGCSDHFRDLCKCDIHAHGCWLYRVDYNNLANYITTLEKSVTATRQWEAEVNAVESLSALDRAIEEGEALRAAHINISLTSLKYFKSLSEKLRHWKRRTIYVTTKKGSLAELQALFEEASTFKIKLPEVKVVEDFLRTAKSCQTQAHLLQKRMSLLKEEELSPKEPNLMILQDENQNLSNLLQNIQKVLDDLGPIALPESSQLQTELAYINWLLAANALMSKSFTNSSISLSTTSEMFPTIGDIDALLSSPARHAVTQGWKLEKLASLRQMCEIEGRRLSQNNSEYPRSLEEMEAMLKRLIQLPAYPLEAVEILETWKRAQKWTDEVTKALAVKIPFSRALALEADGEACGIPPSSILKRQLNGRIQDTKRWLARTQALFKFDSSATSFSLQGALEKNDLEDEKLRLVCTCQQVFNDKVKFVRCCGCSGLFHPVCVGLDPHGSLRSSYLCRECCHLRRRTYPHNFPRSDAVYCVCRESTDSVPMICCDFCDEWYHAKCIGISPTVMSNLEAYRCPGCAFRQGMSHLTSKRPLRPSLKQMIGLITRGDALQIEVPELEDLKALVSLGNDLLAEIIDFERHFLHQCSLESMLTHVDHLKEELQSKVSAVARYETLVILEPAHQKLRTMQWFLRACRLIFETSPAPRYSQLLILLSDAKQDKLEFSTLELQRFYHELEHNVERAIQWVAQVKALRMDRQNLMHLKDEAEEISQYLQLPDAAVTNFNVAFKFHMGAR